METDARQFSRPRRPAANMTQRQGGVRCLVLPVTWQDGDSLGPAPGAAGDFTTKDTKNTKATDESREAAKSAKAIRMTEREMVGV